MSGMHYNYPDSQYLTDPLQMHSVTAAAFVIASFGGIGGGRSPGRLFWQMHSVTSCCYSSSFCLAGWCRRSPGRLFWQMHSVTDAAEKNFSN